MCLPMKSLKISSRGSQQRSNSQKEELEWFGLCFSRLHDTRRGTAKGVGASKLRRKRCLTYYRLN